MAVSATSEPPAVDDEPLALYVHWPFCRSKCPYCDFNSHVREKVDQEAWRRALLDDLAWEAARTGRRRLASIFFGGGTPSLMPPETVAAVIAAARRHWPAVPDLEVTLEANPSSVEVGRFRAYAAAGVGRVSVGVQALNDADLARLGREHDAATARAAIAAAAAIFPRHSFDLIYARPDQDLADWRAELREALALAGDHLSLYTLTLEPNTGFYGAWRRGALVLPDEDSVAAQFELTQEMCSLAGLPGYEISNHARPGGESRHNLVYWRSGDYAGIGPGAHGRLTLPGEPGHGPQRIATVRLRKPEAWLAAVRAQGNGLAEEAGIPPADLWPEALMMGLRLAEGVDLSRLRRRIGVPEAGFVDPAGLDRLLRQGLLWQAGERLGATARGRSLLDAVLSRLLA